MVRIEFDTDNAAFEEEEGFYGEIARILRNAADRIESGAPHDRAGVDGDVYGYLRDLNGNTVGYFEIVRNLSVKETV